jgi:hypothetical protein
MPVYLFRVLCGCSCGVAARASISDFVTVHGPMATGTWGGSSIGVGAEFADLLRIA